MGDGVFPRDAQGVREEKLRVGTRKWTSSKLQGRDRTVWSD
jgi:hypothetical protein